MSEPVPMTCVHGVPITGPCPECAELDRIQCAAAGISREPRTHVFTFRDPPKPLGRYFRDDEHCQRVMFMDAGGADCRLEAVGDEIKIGAEGDYWISLQPEQVRSLHAHLGRWLEGGTLELP